ncbi:MAG: hypothetical protein RJQ03_11945 [Miltoncostaeaceae bacterium]
MSEGDRMEPLERARAVATEDRALPAGTWGRVPVLGPLAARVVGRLLRPHAARQREATADLVQAIDALGRRVEAVEGRASAPAPGPPAPGPPADLDPLRADIEALRTELIELRELLEGHARRATGESAALAGALDRAMERIEAIEERNAGRSAPGSGGDPSS